MRQDLPASALRTDRLSQPTPPLLFNSCHFPRRSFFLFSKQEVQPTRIGHRSYAPADADTTEPELLGKLLSAARNAEQKTTLVFTHDAFTKLCRAADREGNTQF